jgi:N-succinyldiaminopimelate aminotransferase
MRSWLAKRVENYTTSVFEEAAALAREYDAVNLGSGTPDHPLPESLQLAVTRAMAAGRDQYSPVRGEGVLRDAVAAHAARWYGQEVDPATEVTITSGVTEAVHAATLSLIDPGDEVIVFEPCYDCYVPAIRMAGGTPVAVTLRPPAYRVDPQELRKAVTARTRALILNNPHNPSGVVLLDEELRQIASVCQEFDLLAIVDEVYEHIVFDGWRHFRLATLPGMRERTLTLSGAGKTFSCTGWRIGWAIGPAPLQDALSRLRQFTVFAAATPFQLAIAAGLVFPRHYFEELPAEYEGRRDKLLNALTGAGLEPTRPAGGLFVVCDVSACTAASGREFCHELARTARVAAIPLDTFYLSPGRGKRLIRFSFAARPELLEVAGERLSMLLMTVK